MSSTDSQLEQATESHSALFADAMRSYDALAQSERQAHLRISHLRTELSSARAELEVLNRALARVEGEVIEVRERYSRENATLTQNHAAECDFLKRGRDEALEEATQYRVFLEMLFNQLRDFKLKSPERDVPERREEISAEAEKALAFLNRSPSPPQEG